MARARTRIIQVPLDAGLLDRIDRTARAVAESRAAFVREACRIRLRDLQRREQDRRYVDGYRRQPEAGRWPKASAAWLAQALSREDW